jgi:Zn-dependent membrane protease YugP
LPVEFNASSRALSIIRNCGLFNEDEVYVSKKMLSAAALTYVAALAVTMAQVLRLLVIIASRDRKR